MAHGKTKRPKSFGHGFDLMLRELETWEDFFEGRRKKPGKDPSINMDLFNCEVGDDYQTEWLKYQVDMAENAHRLRNSFKFKLDYGGIYAGNQYDVADTMAVTPLSPPFPQCFFILENWHDGCDLMLLVDQRTASHLDTPELVDAYAGHGIYAGDEFISVMPCVYHKNGIIRQLTGERDRSDHLSYWPVEIHFRLHGAIKDGNTGLAAFPKFASPNNEQWLSTKDKVGSHLLLVSALYFILYILSIRQPVRQLGRAPTKARPAKGATKRILYEHHTLEIDPFAAPKGDGGISRPHGSPRLHAVRGFWRTYKSGKKVWVKPHWRGDKDKGVVTKDYSIVGDIHGH